MFTEGLDQSAINWIKEGSDVAQKPRSPLAEKCPIDSTSNLPVFHETYSYLSPKGLPPVKFNSALVSPTVLPISSLTAYVGSEDEAESVHSDPDGFSATFSDISDYEESLSIDSDLCSKSKNKFYDEESHFVCRRPLSRGLSKENLQVNVVVNGGNNISQGHINQEFFTPSWNGHINEDFLSPRCNDQYAPSAPYIAGIKSDENELNVEVPYCNEVHQNMQNIKQARYMVEQSQNNNESHQGTIHEVGEKPMLCLQNNKTDRKITYTTSVQTVWQAFIAYDACFRLCLNAWSRNCLEAPEFLKDECLVLRSAFGIQKFLLQPRGHVKHGGDTNNSEGCSVKGRKVIERIEVEVKRIRMTMKSKQAS